MRGARSKRAPGGRATLFTVLTLVLTIASCDRGEEAIALDQQTPEGVIESARLAVSEGQAERLSELVHADNERMRRVYDKAGTVLGSLQDLAEAVAEHFPREVGRIERLAAEAGEGPARGRRSGLGLGFSPELFQDSDDPVNDAVQRLLADPYGWLSGEASRLSTTTIDDTRVAVLRDGMPIFPPVGLVIEKRPDDKWYVVLPTHYSWIQRFLPKNEDETRIWLALLQVFDNALIDLRKDIESGRVRTLDRAVEVATQKVMSVAPLVIFAYGKAREAREEPEPEPGRD